MGYPGLPLNAARSIDEARRNGTEPSDQVARSVIWKSGSDFDESTGVECLQQCNDIVHATEASGASHGEFDSRCAPTVHKVLSLSVQVAGDPDFWRWLTFTQGHWGAELVDWRYGSQRRERVINTSSASPGLARPVYYGLGPMKKGMFAKLWLCADRMYVEGRPDNPHEYDGIDYADVDLWDSHIIDVDYGSVAAMARAFVTVVRELSLPRGSPNNPDEPPGYRDLAKELRRRQATVVFELFENAEAVQYVRDVWDERESWCKH